MERTYTALSSIRSVALATLWGAFFCLEALAQSVPAPPMPAKDVVAPVICAHLAEPRYAGLRTADLRTGGSIYGTVTDSNGNVISRSSVTLLREDTPASRTQFSDGAGFFNFNDLEPGKFRIKVESNGFSTEVTSEIVLPPGAECGIPKIALEIAPANTDVDVVASVHDVAEAQLKAEEKQRVLGFIPNFYISYIWNAAPLTPKQKFHLALRSLVDPVGFAVTGVFAGVEQWQNEFGGYGQGAEGYAKRYGALYADGFAGTMIGGAILPSVLHQDPRYFYKGTGSITSRALYAISTTVICRGDNGHWQPNYSAVLGNMAAAGISNLYYPSANRGGADVTIDNALIGTATNAVSALIQEFLFRKISRGVPENPKPGP